ncbi:MAG: hypothetical protein ACM33B_10850 [Pseudomonadota bacterium]
MSGFDDPALLREALEEVADALPGSYVEEPWGSSALAAAEEVARHGTDAELRALALRAVVAIAESSELRDLGDDDARIDDVLSRLQVDK